MKRISFVVSLLCSVAVLSMAVILGSFAAKTGVSYGWVEHFYSNSYLLYSTISSIIVLLGGIAVSTIIMSGNSSGPYRSYLPLLLYSSIMSLAIGDNFLYIAVAGLFIVLTLYVLVLKGRDPEPISGTVFKMVLAIFILSILYPAMIWLVLPLVLAISYFRPTGGKDLAVLFLSFLMFGAYCLWFFWFFGVDTSEVKDCIIPEFSTNYSLLSDSVAIGMLVFVLGSWITFKRNMATVDSISCKIEQCSFLLVIIVSLLLFFLDGSEWVIPLLAPPVSLIVYIHIVSSASKAVSTIVVAIFYLVLAGVAGSMLYLSPRGYLLVQFFEWIWSAVKDFIVW